MVEVKWNKDHHAGGDPASRIAYRERFSGQSYPDAHARGVVKPDHVVPSTRDRTISGIHHPTKGNGPVRFEKGGSR